MEIESTTPTHPVTSSEMKGNEVSSPSTRRNDSLITHTSDTHSHSSGNDGNDPTLGGNVHFRQRTQLDPLQGMGGPMTRSRTKKMQESLATLIKETQTKEEMRINDFDSYFVNFLSIIVNGSHV